MHVNENEKLTFLCKCGETFITTFGSFKRSNKRQCNTCGRKNRNKDTRLTHGYVRDFVKNNSKSVLLSKSYENVDAPLVFLCKCGNEYTTTFYRFKNDKKQQCDSCGFKNGGISKRKTIEEVALAAASRNCELITKNYKSSNQLLTFRCSCGNLFKTTYSSLTGKYHQKNKCSRCSKSESKGEVKISQFLTEHNLKFDKQVKIKGCEFKRPLKFDFVVYNTDEKIKFIIEYDGEQHRKAVEHFGGDEKFLKTKKRDEIKNDFCNKNNILLVRISDLEFEFIDEILTKILKQP
ncbi:DUF2726 domain-containing protein [Bacillus cereus]|uniref:DUF2726 domain-containing protein n=1 Tax=Bacillus cereus TaxID=1396 RepID=UPI001879B264|nr:DUF2726 domain-containing protein [Bacillus cereus]MBE7106504.1 DUF2726 domain-containing protein [Bacillus cereus]